MRRLILAALMAGVLLPGAAQAAEISTHVLDLARGVGSRDVPVVLSQRNAAGIWVEVARALTRPPIRTRSFPKS